MMIDSSKWTPEQNLAFDALDSEGYRVRGYTDSEQDRVTHMDFTTTKDLHAAYMRFCYKNGVVERKILYKRTAFGRVLSSILKPACTPYRMWILNQDDGQRYLLNGYNGIKGPASHVRRHGAGRPKTSDVE